MCSFQMLSHYFFCLGLIQLCLNSIIALRDEGVISIGLYRATDSYLNFTKWFWTFVTSNTVMNTYVLSLFKQRKWPKTWYNLSLNAGHSIAFSWLSVLHKETFNIDIRCTIISVKLPFKNIALHHPHVTFGTVPFFCLTLFKWRLNIIQE